MDKFKLGKIFQKFLIIEILSFYGTIRDITSLLYQLSNSSRKYLKDNFKYISKLAFPKPQKTTVLSYNLSVEKYLKYRKTPTKLQVDIDYLEEASQFCWMLSGIDAIAIHNVKFKFNNFTSFPHY